MTSRATPEALVSRCAVLGCERPAVTSMVGAGTSTNPPTICQAHLDAIQDGAPWRVQAGDPPTLLVGAAARRRRPAPPPEPVMTLIEDPEHGTVAVWWRSTKKHPWLCTRCGLSVTPSCWHTQAAAVSLRRPPT